MHEKVIPKALRDALYVALCVRCVKRARERIKESHIRIIARVDAGRIGWVCKRN